MDDITGYDTTSRDDAGVRTLKPVLAELVRTQVYPPVLELLVDQIFIDTNVKVKGGYAEAFRVQLSDGEYCIQALLKAELHPFLLFDEILEGSYVSIMKYELATAKRLDGKGYVLHLRIAYLEAAGFDGRTPTRLGFDNLAVDHKLVVKNTLKEMVANSEAKNVNNVAETSTRGEPTTLDSNPKNEKDSFADDLPEEDLVDLIQWHTPPELSVRPCNNGTPSKKRKHEEVESALQPLSPNVNSSPTKPSPRVSRLQRADTEPPFPPKGEKSDNCPAKRPHLLPNPSTAISTLLPISQPLQITPLANLVGPKSSTGKLVDVFGVIYSVTPTLIKCAGSVHYKREIRITDPSTSKKVLLSVFAEPELFEPAIGTVALFRSLTTNKWDGGSLNAYKRDCAGKEWFIPDPFSVQACDVKRLKAWWRKARAEEAAIKSAVGLTDNEIMAR